jgi:hypothetical protein
MSQTDIIEESLLQFLEGIPLRRGPNPRGQFVKEFIEGAGNVGE